MENTRSKELFNQGWKFHKGDLAIPRAVKAGMTGGITDAGEEDPDGEWLRIAYVDKQGFPAVKEQDWLPVKLPHDWCAEGSQVNDNRLGARVASSGYLTTGVGCYRKEFQIPAWNEGCRISLTFDGVMRNSTVWVNGHLMGTHFSGYTGFSYDISDVARYGDEGTNIVLVRVDATEYEGWWYDGCGIYRDVWLEKTPALRVAPYGVYVSTPQVQDGCAEVELQATIENTREDGHTVTVCHTIRNVDGVVVASGSAEIEVERCGSAVQKQTLQVKQPILWSVERPYLYRVETILKLDETVVDGAATIMGIRTARFTPEGFFLNGERQLIKGVCCHQDFAGVGVALPNSIMEYRLQLLKEMGCNAYRSAHHPASPAFLDMCDRVGMLVLDENRKLSSTPDGLDEIRRMVVQHRNHPCIILWGLENEEILEGTAMGGRILRTLHNTVRSLDASRQTVTSMNHGWNDGGYGEKADIVGYNYGQRENQYIDDLTRHPNRVKVSTESSSVTTTRGIYEADYDKCYCPEYGYLLPEWGCTSGKAWRDVAEHPELSGVFIWTGFDYRGEPTPFEWPSSMSHFGIMDNCGFPKDRYYYFRANWTEERVLHLLPHWNWEGREGDILRVGIYSNCVSAELFVNGHSYGEKAADCLSMTDWQVPYEPGAVWVVGKWADGTTQKTVRETTGAPNRIVLLPQRSVLHGDGCDTVPVRVQVVDEQGRVVPYAENMLQFSIEGEGSVLGVGNGDPSRHDSDKASYCRAFNGLCLCLVQAGGTVGGISLKVQSHGLLSTAAELTVEA